jgi:anti-anti-sigma factor
VVDSLTILPSSDPTDSKQSGFRVAHFSHRGIEIVSVAGEVDPLTAPAVERALAAVEPGRPVVIDLACCTFIDARGYLVVHDAAARIREAGEVFAIVTGRGHVARVLRMLGAERSFLLYSDWSETFEQLELVDA